LTGNKVFVLGNINMSKSGLGEDDLSLPLSPEMLRRRKNIEPTAELPEALRPPPEPPRKPRQVRLIDRSKQTGADGVRQTAGYCPPWAGVAYAPKRMRMAAPTKVLHRGRELEPRIDFPPVGDQQFYNDPVMYPWRCVCRISNAFGKVGSGALIGPRHILTASHCVAWSTTSPEKIEVHIAGDVVQAVAFDVAALAYTHIEGDSAPSNVLDEDYAVLVTDERLGDRFGWLGAKEYNSSWDGDAVWGTMGYPAVSFFPTFQNQQWLDEDAWDYGSGRAMTTSADILSGHSGSPMFGRWDEGAFAVAVMSSDDPPARDNWCAGGSDLPRLVNLARSDFP
jgi:V8-like Glu-specific endopeptidase